jgi:transposase
MQDYQLYEQILGLRAPWRVKAVKLLRPAQEIEIEVECTEQVWGCPQCQERMHVHDWERRRWRHLDSCQFKTYIAMDVPRVICPEHGSVTVTVPWAEPYGRFTGLFERLAIDLLLESSVLGSCEILRISWDEADGIKQRAVERGQARQRAEPIRLLGVDEKSAGRGQNYVTVVANLEPGQAARVAYVGDGRTEETLNGYWTSLPAEHRAVVEAVAMDLWEPYRNATLAHVPGAAEKIVHDPYHLGRMLSDAVDKVRKAEHRVLREAGDERLAGTKYLWLYGWENLPELHYERFDDLRGQRLKTSRAWAIKELFRDFWASATVEEGRQFFQRWYSWSLSRSSECAMGLDAGLGKENGHGSRKRLPCPKSARYDVFGQNKP